MISLYSAILIVGYGKSRECVGAYFWVGRGWYASWAARNTICDVIIVNLAAVTLQQSFVQPLQLYAEHAHGNSESSRDFVPVL